jgi:hypothetical protein
MKRYALLPHNLALKVAARIQRAYFQVIAALGPAVKILAKKPFSYFH